jgi:hypothetical protein
MEKRKVFDEKYKYHRIKEKYYNENCDQVIQDLIEIIKDKNSKTYYNYSNLTKIFTNK